VPGETVANLNLVPDDILEGGYELWASDIHHAPQMAEPVRMQGIATMVCEPPAPALRVTSGFWSWEAIRSIFGTSISSEFPGKENAKQFLK
jgi:hypothetical protein